MDDRREPPVSGWLRWFPAPEPTVRNGWRLIRFAEVDARGAPLGKAIAAQTPAGATRMFPSEQRAQWAADELNRQERR